MFELLSNAMSVLTVKHSLPSGKVTNPDVSRIIESDEIQAVLRPEKEVTIHSRRKLNPLKNKKALYHLNPYAEELRKCIITATGVFEPNNGCRQETQGAEGREEETHQEACRRKCQVAGDPLRSLSLSTTVLLFSSVVFCMLPRNLTSLLIVPFAIEPGAVQAVVESMQ